MACALAAARFGFISASVRGVSGTNDDRRTRDGTVAEDGEVPATPRGSPSLALGEVSVPGGESVDRTVRGDDEVCEMLPSRPKSE
jgi:hypothetical protein